MKSNDGIPSNRGKENEVCVFFRWFVKWKYSKKKIARLVNEESIHFQVFWKTSASKTYKSSHQEVFPKIGVLKIQASRNGLYKI